MANINANELFLYKGISYKGDEIGVFIIDSGIKDACNIANIFINLATKNYFYIDKKTKDHGHRVAALCSGNNGVNNHKLNGLAPNAKYYSDSYLRHDSFNDLIQSIDETLFEDPSIKILAFAYSAPSSALSDLVGNKFMYDIASKYPEVLIIAASGHDGDGNLRFPATADSVLSVGTYNNQTDSIAGYCGKNSSRTKPEILIPDNNYITYNEDGSESTINGTSAAVAIISGIAVLIYEHFKQKGKCISSNSIKGVLLVLSKEIRNSNYRLMQSLTIKILQQLSTLVIDCKTFVRLDISKKTSNSDARVAILVAGGDVSTLFLTTPPEIEIRYRNGLHVCIIRHTGYNYVLPVTNNINSIEIHLLKPSKISLTGLNVLISNVSPIIDGESLTIIGVSASHNSSACLMVNGKIERAIQLERLTHVKNDGKPYLADDKAIKYCLASYGIKSEQVARYAFNIQALIPGWTGLSQPVAIKEFAQFDPFSKQSTFVSHHLAHAFAAFAASPFQKAIVMVCDGAGGATVGSEDLIINGHELYKYINQELDTLPRIQVSSTYEFTRSSYTLINREYAPSFNVRSGSSSPGELYASVSQFIFGNWMDSGKLMGLAPYGDPENFGNSIISNSSKHQFKQAWKNNYCKSAGATDVMQYKDLAARVQKDFEDVILNKIVKTIETLESKQINFIFTGGLALNCVLNHKISKIARIKETYFYSGSNDSGISVGAAVAAYFKENGKIPSSILKNDYLGHPYNPSDVQMAISKYKDFVEPSSLVIIDLADKIISGHIIAWFHNGSEFGPRALGNRSILACARNKSTWIRINKEIKYREEFRPLAPIVPIEFASIFFETDKEHRNMMEVVRVKKEWQESLGAITHIDGTARLQTVSKADHPLLHQLLLEVGHKTGIPVLVNTSMNCAGKTIVETPMEAIEFMLSTNIYALIINDVCLHKPTNHIFDSTKFAFTPDVSLQSTVDNGATSFQLTSTIGGKTDFKIPEYLFYVLSKINLNEFGKLVMMDTEHSSQIENWISILFDNNYLMAKCIYEKSSN